ncbi:hypothetical protein [Acetobacter estunensis]|uniref:hypothetical protein n=1 Tax=Acetobacter estunensis TaxID=104097 RepID=UPI001C2DB49F|nr:hypothetical protein [Acetobacter estunensis]MBV1837310.1 hypothetical protein [Acetobacter estunensis]
MRDLTTTELNEVSGGCGGGGWSGGGCQPSYNPCGGYQPSWNSCVSSAGMIAAYAGYLAGEYNVTADIYNHASCSTIQSAVCNVYADVKEGYTLGQSMTVCQATTLLNNVVASIHAAVTLNGCGQVTAMNTITFPPSSGGGGFGS